MVRSHANSSRTPVTRNGSNVSRTLDIKLCLHTRNSLWWQCIAEASSHYSTCCKECSCESQHEAGKKCDDSLSAVVTFLRGKLEWIMMENARSYDKRGGSEYTVKTNDLHEDKYINCRDLLQSHKSDLCVASKKIQLPSQWDV